MQNLDTTTNQLVGDPQATNQLVGGLQTTNQLVGGLQISHQLVGCLQTTNQLGAVHANYSLRTGANRNRHGFL